MNISEAKIIDVRTPGEFAGGHVEGSINIPLDTFQQRITELVAMKEPLVLCCASGSRSMMACQFLAQNGKPDIYNGGPWQNVERLLTVETLG